MVCVYFNVWKWLSVTSKILQFFTIFEYCYLNVFFSLEISEVPDMKVGAYCSQKSIALHFFFIFLFFFCTWVIPHQIGKVQDGIVKFCRDSCLFGSTWGYNMMCKRISFPVRRIHVFGVTLKTQFCGPPSLFMLVSRLLPNESKNRAHRWKEQKKKRFRLTLRFLFSRPKYQSSNLT